MDNEQEFIIRIQQTINRRGNNITIEQAKQIYDLFTFWAKLEYQVYRDKLEKEHALL